MLLFDGIATLFALTVGCSLLKSSPGSHSRLTSNPENEDNSDQRGKRMLTREIDSLPPSVIRDLLIYKVRPLYQPDYPSELDFAGVVIKIKEPSVKLIPLDIGKVSSDFNFRRKGSPRLEQFFPVHDSKIKLPYTSLLLEGEKTDIPAANLSPDRTMLIDIDYPTQIPLYEGLAPEITIESSDLSSVSPAARDLNEAFIRFVAIKAMCSQLIIQLWLDETVRKMQSWGLNPYVQARRADGSIAQAEAISQSVTTIQNREGRWMAALGIGSSLMAFKSIEKSEIYDAVALAGNFRQVMESIKNFHLGESPSEILNNSCRWALTDKAAKLLPYIGALNRVP